MKAFSELYPKKHLTPVDAKKGAITLTIAGFGEEEVGYDQEEKEVVYFHETEKYLILSPPHAKAFTECFDDDPESAVGQKVVMDAVEEKIKGVATLVLRVLINKTIQANRRASTPPPRHARPGAKVEAAFKPVGPTVAPVDNGIDFVETDEESNEAPF